MTASSRRSPVRVRRGRREEAHEIAALWLRSRAASVPAIPEPVHTDEEVHAWFEQIVLREREVWVAEDETTVVGIAVLEDDWIDQLYVHPDHTGHGIGAELMSVAKQQRPSGPRLWAFQSNAGARRFYEGHGFIANGATDGHNEEGAPDVRYEWSPASPP